MKAHEIFSSSVSADERLVKVRAFDIDGLWSVLYAEHVQETVLKAARSRLNRLIKEARRLVMTFEDHGQDFLTWTLDKNGKVIDSNAQFWCWGGGHVTNPAAFRSQVVGLTAHQRRAAGRTGQHATALCGNRRRHARCERFEGQGLEGIATENGRRFVELAMAGGAAPAEIVIIHRRQIIVHE